MRSLSEISRKIYIYQLKRFPVFPLLLILLSVSMSSAAIVGHPHVFTNIALACIGALLYLLHVRIIDDFRDYEHDNNYHYDRPVQQGIISLKSLRVLDFMVLIGLGIISILSGFYSLILLVILFLFSYAARYDFFLDNFFKEKFFTYNGTHFLQMPLLQLYIYSFFIINISFNEIFIYHFCFILMGSLISELARKIYAPQDESTGNDTYSWHLGFKVSNLVFLWFFLLQICFFLLILLKLSAGQIFGLIFAIMSAGIMLLGVTIQIIKSARLLQRSIAGIFFVSYILMNGIIYYGLII